MGADFGFWDLQYSMRRAALVKTCFSSLGRMVAFQVKRPWLGCCLQYSSSATRAVWIISPVKRASIQDFVSSLADFLVTNPWSIVSITSELTNQE
jgi:hypothetical protein